MAHYTGKHGELRIYDSTAGEDLSQSGPKEVHVSNFNSAAHVDDTADALSSSGSLLTVWSAADGVLYVGCHMPFSVIDVDVSTAAVGAGAMTAEYYNGAWTSLTIEDGTESGGEALAIDGQIRFTEPSDWALVDTPSAGTTLYYVRLSPTTNPSTDPILEYISPISGQYYKVLFAQMDLSIPQGRAKVDENLELDRGNMDANAFYYEGSDDPIMEPLDVSFSCLLDEGVNAATLLTALELGDLNTTNWPDTGISTKGDTLNDGVNANPTFADASKKCANMQCVFEGTTTDLLLTANEVYFPPEEQSIQESEGVLTLSVTGKVYGTITRETATGTKYFGNILT